jgi:hypothetical protein
MGGLLLIDPDDDPLSGVPGGLYRMCRAQLRVLDENEPHYERKRRWVLDSGGARQRAWVYEHHPPVPPSNVPHASYLKPIEIGYANWHLDRTLLERAIAEAHVTTVVPPPPH